MDRLLISTKNYLGYFDGKRLHKVHKGAFFYYGISQFGAGDIVVAATDDKRRTTILRFDPRLKSIRDYAKIDGESDVHQIICYDGMLWVCNTWNDRVDVYRNGKVVNRWKPFPTTNELHLNSVNVVDGLLHVSAHNRSRRPSEIYVMDRSFSPRAVIEVGHDIHNVWTQDAALMVAATTESCLVSLIRGRRETMPLVPSGWLRGVASSKDRTYIGVSRIADRDQRKIGDAEIRVFDNSWPREVGGVVRAAPQCAATIPLPNAGQVYEVRLIGKPDSAHGGKTMSLQR